MEVTEERKAKLSVLLQSYIDTESITEAEAGRLYGESRFVICPRLAECIWQRYSRCIKSMAEPQ